MRPLQCLLILSIILLPASPFATTFTVTKEADTSDGTCDLADCSLREAIEAANAVVQPDIVVIPAGTYMLTLGEQLTITDDLNITNDGDDQLPTIIDGGGTSRVLEIQAGSTVGPREMVEGRRGPAGIV